MAFGIGNVFTIVEGDEKIHCNPKIQEEKRIQKNIA